MTKVDWQIARSSALSEGIGDRAGWASGAAVLCRLGKTTKLDPADDARHNWGIATESRNRWKFEFTNEGSWRDKGIGGG